MEPRKETDGKRKRETLTLTGAHAGSRPVNVNVCVSRPGPATCHRHSNLVRADLAHGIACERPQHGILEQGLDRGALRWAAGRPILDSTRSRARLRSTSSVCSSARATSRHRGGADAAQRDARVVPDLRVLVVERFDQTGDREAANLHERVLRARRHLDIAARPQRLQQRVYRLRADGSECSDRGVALLRRAALQKVHQRPDRVGGIGTEGL